MIENLLSWLSSGPLGLGLGIFGILAVYFFFKKMTPNKTLENYQKDIERSNDFIAKESTSIGHAEEKDEEILDSVEKEAIDFVVKQEKEFYAPKVVFCPDVVKTNERFIVKTANISNGSQVQVDGYVVGHISNNQVIIVLNSAGERMLSIDIENGSLKKKITVISDIL